MLKRYKKLRSDSGAGFIVILMIIVILGLLVTGLISIMETEIVISSNYEKNSQVNFNVKSGFSECIKELTNRIYDLASDENLYKIDVFGGNPNTGYKVINPDIWYYFYESDTNRRVELSWENQKDIGGVRIEYKPSEYASLNDIEIDNPFSNNLYYESTDMQSGYKEDILFINKINKLRFQTDSEAIKKIYAYNYFISFPLTIGTSGKNFYKYFCNGVSLIISSWIIDSSGKIASIKTVKRRILDFNTLKFGKQEEMNFHINGNNWQSTVR